MERVAAVRQFYSVAAACVLSLSGVASAAEFFTGFDDLPDVIPADTFTVTVGTLNVEFSGGIVGVGLAQSPSKSWMIDPVGINGSTGMGTATLSEGATRLDVFGTTQSAGIEGVVRVYDEAGALIEEGTATEINWAGLTVIRDPAAGESLIKSVEITVVSPVPGPNQRVAIDDFGFFTGSSIPGEGDPEGEEEEEQFDDSGVSSLAISPFLLFLTGVGWYFAAASRRRRD